MSNKKSYDLIFSKPLNNKNPINLIFGDDDSTTPIDREHIASATVDLYEFSLFDNVYVDYGIDYNRVSSNKQIHINKASQSNSDYNLLLNDSFKLDHWFFYSFANAQIINYLYFVTWGETNKLKSYFINDWHIARLVQSNDINFGIYNSYLSAADSENQWGSADNVFYNRNPFFWYALKDIANRDVKFLSAINAGRKYETVWNVSDVFTNKKNIIWNIAGLPSGCGPSIRPPVIPPKPPKPDVITIKRDLIFCKKPNNKNPIDLVFGDECEWIDNGYSIPEKDVYIVQNNVEIFRTDDNKIIKAFTVDIGASRQDYLWSGSLSLPFSELEKIVDTPEIEININQYKFIVDVNDISIKQEFNSKLIEISVSSTTNRLKTIKAHNLMRDASSIAIMSAQLSRDDLETGFKFVSQNSVDWVIPNGIIEYDDAFALDIINSIALAVGDTVISHAHNKEIIVKEKYSSEDTVYSLPIGKLFDYGTDEIESEEYNAVVVTGENKGVTAVVRKDGTAGEKIASMIVNKLITGQEAARRAAINAIFNTSDRSVMIDAESVLFKEAPMIYPSDAVKIGNDVGWVDDVNIRCEMSNKTLIVRHSISIEKKVV